MYSQFVIRIRQFMRSTKRTAYVEWRWGTNLYTYVYRWSVCFLMCRQTYILSASPPTYWLVVIIMTSRLRLYYLPACSLELSSAAIWYMVAYIPAAPPAITISFAAASEPERQQKQRKGLWWWCVPLLWCDVMILNGMIWLVAIQYHRTQHTSAKMCSVWYKRCDYVSMS